MTRMACNSEDHWQSNKGVCARNHYMLQNELKTDIVFKVSSPLEPGPPQTVRAHRYMLISASPVFWAMLCGQLREDGDVIVPDVTPHVFREMLKFIYTEQVAITGNNALQILHTAKKYQLSDLLQRCIDFLEQELDASNACCMLGHSQFFGENQLVTRCLEIIEANTAEALNSDDFRDISAETLGVILDSDKLCMEEVDLFERCYEWAETKTDNERSIRDVLGTNLFRIRFPTMSSKVFTEKVCSKDILSTHEQLEILKYLASPQSSEKPAAFGCEPREPLDQRPLEHPEQPARQAWASVEVQVGDRVRVTRSQQVCFGIGVRAGEEGVVQALSGSSCQVKLDRGLLIAMDMNLLQKL